MYVAFKSLFMNISTHISLAWYNMLVLQLRVVILFLYEISCLNSDCQCTFLTFYLFMVYRCLYCNTYVLFRKFACYVSQLGLYDVRCEILSTIPQSYILLLILPNMKSYVEISISVLLCICFYDEYFLLALLVIICLQPWSETYLIFLAAFWAYP